MEFLPKVHTEFGEKRYWDRFFAKRGNEAFEWYGDYLELSGILHKYIKVTDNILTIGCGNSKLSPDLYDGGFRKINNIDISDIVIKKMIKIHGKDRSEMTWHTMDAKQMSFKDSEFAVVLDKGTTDALMTGSSSDVKDDVKKMFSEIERVLKFGGRFICVSLLQSHILQFLLEWFSDVGCLMRIHRCQEAEMKSKEENPDRVIFPVFVVVFTKLKKIPGVTPVLELCLSDNKCERFNDHGEVIKFIQSIQDYAFIRHGLHKENIQKEEISVELFQPGEKEYRYCLYVVDRAKKSKVKFAIFIVPAGREAEWMFNTPEGRQYLGDSTECQRLVVVHLNRNHTYENLESVKAELSSRVMELAPYDLPQRYQVPFWSAGDDIGSREVIKRGKSDLSGEYVVEDSEGEFGELFRRLIFLSNRNAVQSEAKLKLVTKKKGKKTRSVDHSYLACDHHKLIITGLSFIPGLLSEEVRVLVIGLGGGSLPMFIRNYVPQVKLDVVDIDSEIVEVAKNYYNFVEDSQMTVFVADGCEYLGNCAMEGTKYHSIVLDVDSKDVTVGMSSPPQVFLENEVLKNIQNILLEDGLLIMNLACRNEKLKKDVFSDLRKIFPCVYSLKVQDEINEVVYCLTDSKWKKQVPTHLKAAVEAMANQVTKKSKQGDLLELDFANKLSIL